ncbi:MAG: hypothetical protein AAF907_07350 [Planctomycetota bacterium]
MLPFARAQDDILVDESDRIAATAEPITLTALGAIDCGPAPPAGPIRDVAAFDIDDRGRLGLIRRSGRNDDPPAFVLIDPAGGEDGQLVLEAPLDGVEALLSPTIVVAWTGEDGWVAVATKNANELDDRGEIVPVTESALRRRAWRIDPTATPALTPLPSFPDHCLWAIDGTGDGGFVGIAWQSEGAYPTGLVRCDAHGDVV